MTDASSVSLGGETAKATVAKFAMAASGFIGTILFARLLGPVAFGGFYLLFSLVKIADRPIGGLGSATKKRFSEANAPQREIVGALFLAIGSWFALTAIGTLVLGDWLRSYTGLESAPVLFALLMSAVMLYEPFEHLLHARGLVGAATGIDMLRSYLTLPLQLLLVFLGFGAAGMAYGLAGGTFLAVPLLLYYIRIVPVRPSRTTIRSLWAYAKYSIPGNFIGKAYNRFDVLLLGFIVAPATAAQAAVGQYEVAAKLTLPAIFVAETAGSGLMARVSNLHSRGEEIAPDVSNTLAFTSILSIPVFFGALAIPRQLVVTIYGPKFAPAAPFLIGLALYRVLTTLNGPLLQTLGGMDRPDVTLRLAALTLAFNVVAGVVLTLRFGPIGVVIATILAESLRYLGAIYSIKRHLTGIDLFPRTLLQQVLAAVGMFTVVSAFHSITPVRSWLDLSVLLTIGGATYSIVLLGISRELRLTIGSVLRGSRIERYVPKRILNW